MMAAAMAEADEEESGGGGGATVSVTFSEPGSLGMKLSPNASGQVAVIGINPGTQAEKHPQLRAGLVIVAVAGSSARGKGYKEVLGMIKAAGRPITLSFEPSGSAAPPVKAAIISPKQQALQSVAKSRNMTVQGLQKHLKNCEDDECRQIINHLKTETAKFAAATKPVKAASDENLTGKAAAKALQAHIQTSGTGDIQKIARLRRASLQADASPASQVAQAKEAAMMAAAIAEADEEEDDLSQWTDSHIKITFSLAGSLGLKLSPVPSSGQIRHSFILTCTASFLGP